MKTVQITMDERLAQEVDRTVEKLGTTRSGFTRGALREALRKIEREELERRQRQGYERHPVRPGEFDVWEAEQVWVE
jgi:metal-responsive CopG/Arc/MetJ family transcriptional regulator